ncbi:MAG TPA: pirin family protein [Candidatus Limnocylindria bacterium]|nr:pirin family protein [Candidatus Limnocylindria bacterium]
MPAISADLLTLPRLAAPALDSVPRPVVTRVTAPSMLEGEGFLVHRPFVAIPHQLTDPFILLDQMGEVEYGPGEAKGAPDHPHRGFETVTYMLDGTLQHRDSTGGGGLITDGATQWMTAGSGLVHSEMPPPELVATGGLFHGVQLWVNLPAAQKWTPPRYQDIDPGSVRLVASADGAALVRIIAGELDGWAGPGATHTPIAYAHATLHPEARLSVAWRPDFNALVYALGGSGRVGPSETPIRGGQMAVLGPGGHVTLSADAVPEGPAPNLEVLLLGGRPIGEPIAAYGPFVMNTREEIMQAVADYQAGRMGVIPPASLSIEAAARRDTQPGHLPR